MGCLRALFVRIGCAALFVVALALGFVYREQVVAIYRRLRGMPPAVEAPLVPPAPGGGAGAAAELRRLAERGGPAYVDLSAAQVAALVDDALRRAGGRAVESVSVGLLDGELRVRGSLDLSGLPRSLLGPLSGALGRREPLVIGGPLAVESTGTLVLRVTTLRIRDFPFPRGTIPAIVRQLRVPGSSGAAVPVPGAEGVGDVRITPQHVRLYRSSPR